MASCAFTCRCEAAQRAVSTVQQAHHALQPSAGSMSASEASAALPTPSTHHLLPAGPAEQQVDDIQPALLGRKVQRRLPIVVGGAQRAVRNEALHCLPTPAAAAK